jgi:hypothetical protein
LRRRKEALRTPAEREHRCIVNMAKMMTRDYCVRNGATIPEQGALFDEGVRTPPRRS